MTPETFRQLALGLPAVVEWMHQGLPDFHVNGRLVASLGWPDAGWGLMCLPPAERTRLMRSWPGVFHPSPGERKAGSALVRLEAAEEAVVWAALWEAWRHNAGARLLKRYPAPSPRPA